MSKRKRLTGKAEEMRQIAQLLRQNKTPESAVRAALLAMCGVETQVVYKNDEIISRIKSRTVGDGPVG